MLMATMIEWRLKPILPVIVVYPLRRIFIIGYMYVFVPIGRGIVWSTNYSSPGDKMPRLLLLSPYIHLWSTFSQAGAFSGKDYFSAEEVGHDFCGMCILLLHIICNVCFCWLSRLTWVLWAHIAAYGKCTLIRIHDQPPLISMQDIPYSRKLCYYANRDHDIVLLLLYLGLPYWVIADDGIWCSIHAYLFGLHPRTTSTTSDRKAGM